MAGCYAAGIGRRGEAIKYCIDGIEPELPGPFHGQILPMALPRYTNGIAMVIFTEQNCSN
jgi:hypothetical protein